MAADPSLFQPNDLSLLEKCPKEGLPKVIHGFLDTICHHGAIRFKDYSKVWNVSEWKLLTTCWTCCLKSFVKNNFSCEQMCDQLDQHAVSKDIQKIVIECLNPRKDEIKLAFIDETCGLSHAKLKDFDWKLKLIMASDKLANMRQPVVSLDLDIEKKQERKEVSVELSKDELKDLISSLEAANRIVMQLKG